MIARIRALFPVLLALAFLFGAGAGSAHATSMLYLVTVQDTSALATTTGTLEFQFNANGPSGMDTAAIKSFNGGGGTVGSVAYSSGSVSGDLTSLPLTLTANTPYNVLGQNFTYGNSIQFMLDVTTKGSSPGDVFSFAMLDQNGNPVNVGPNGYSAVEIDLSPSGGSGGLQVPTILTGDGVVVTPLVPTPEPSSAVLMSLTALGFGGYRLVRRKGRRSL